MLLLNFIISISLLFHPFLEKQNYDIAVINKSNISFSNLCCNSDSNSNICCIKKKIKCKCQFSKSNHDPLQKIDLSNSFNFKYKNDIIEQSISLFLNTSSFDFFSFINFNKDQNFTINRNLPLLT